MRVVVTSPVWSLNGVNVFAAALARGLQSAGASAHILLTGVTYRERKPLPFPGDVAFEQLKIPRGATWNRRRRALLEYLEARAPCIYLPNHDFNHSCVSTSLSPAVGVAGIIHSDDKQHYDHAARLGGSWNATIAVSTHIGRRLIDDGVVEESRLSVIPYGVPVATTLPRRGNQSPLRILYAGRLEQDQKRVGDLILIARLLDRRGLNFEMTIVGGGPERDRLEREISQASLGSRVRLLPPANNARVIELCAEHDAFVLPSLYEGMPISVLEAMGQGCVPFVSDIASGVPELIRHGVNGYVVPRGDVEAFARELERFSMDSESRERMARDTWQSAAGGGYRSQDMMSRYIEVFQRVEHEMSAGSFVRRGNSGGCGHLSIRDRIAAPLWSLRPSLRAQHGIAE